MDTDVRLRLLSAQGAGHDGLADHGVDPVALAER